jgi:alpha-glucosidase
MNRTVTYALILGLLALPAPAHAAPPTRWELSNGQVAAVVALARDGAPTISARHGRTTVVEPSKLGLRVPDVDLSTGLRFTGRSDRRVSERYTTTSGRRLQHVAEARETTLRFTKRGYRLDLTVRVATDGVAYRYSVRGPSWVTVLGEASEFAVPTSADAFLLPYDNGRGDYESIHVHKTVAAADPVEYGFPSLFHVGDSWLLVTESDLDAGYGGARLTLSPAKRFQLTLPDPNETSPAPLVTPWRTMIIGDLATVTESDLVTDLARPSKIADTSWIKAGTGAWSWWSEGTGNLARQKQYVDYAARMGWRYNLVDSGWNAAWMPELCEYARSRGVGILAWVRWQTIDAQSERDRLFPQYKAWGVAGLKIDFMESDSQDRMRWYDAVLADTAKHQLVLNFHGGTIPRGTERTWPHLLTVEAVRGGEGTRPNPTRVPYPPEHYVTLPFTRNLQGPMDFTPVTFSGVRLNSDGHELALGVVYESGIQHLSDMPENYARYPLAERLMRVLPAAWDETELLAGDPGKLAVLARRHGTDWFVGAITAGPSQTLAAPLSFLGPGEWIAEIYQDGPDGKNLVLASRRVTSGDTLTVPVAVNGGYTAHLCPATPGRASCAG